MLSSNGLSKFSKPSEINSSVHKQIGSYDYVGRPAFYEKTGILIRNSSADLHSARIGKQCFQCIR